MIYSRSSASTTKNSPCLMQCTGPTLLRQRLQAYFSVIDFPHNLYCNKIRRIDSWPLSFTLHSLWGSSHWSPGPQDQLHTPPAALLAEFALPLLLCVAECFLFPVVGPPHEEKMHLWATLIGFCFGFLLDSNLPDGRSWPALPKTRVLGKSPSSQSEHWNGVAEERHKNCTLTHKTDVMRGKT